MKLEMVQGCICDTLEVDGEREVDLTKEQRDKVIDKVCEFLKTKNDGCNQLLQMVLPLYGEYEDLGHCECCGDWVDKYSIDL